jgi:predicted nucleotidyltransferase/uncharacterized protein YutE (UPF0331/DUF86 family)
MDGVIDRLTAFFSAREDVAFALLFGSRASGFSGAESDWDIAVYFRSTGLDLEESEARFDSEDRIWAEAEGLAGAPVDLVILNRAPATLAAAALLGGRLLSCRDRVSYGRFLAAATLLAEEERDFAADFAKIKARSRSLSEIDRDRLIRILDFIASELADSSVFETIDRAAYFGDSALRRNLERWVENLVNSSIDLAKILEASRGMAIPQTYRETLLRLSGLPGFAVADCESLAAFTRLRNLLAHEYLELRYPAIQDFVHQAPEIYGRIVEATRMLLA